MPKKKDYYAIEWPLKPSIKFEVDLVCDQFREQRLKILREKQKKVNEKARLRRKKG